MTLHLTVLRQCLLVNPEATDRARLAGQQGPEFRPSCAARTSLTEPSPQSPFTDGGENQELLKIFTVDSTTCPRWVVEQLHLLPQ